MNKKIRSAIWILLSLLWIGFIFYNSSQDNFDSNNRSRKFISEIKEAIFKVKDISNEETSSKNDNKVNTNSKVQHISQKYNVAIRKLAHAFEYFILAVLLTKAFFSLGVRGRHSLGYILFMIILCAVLDEFHQLFVQGRGSSVGDILIDFSGGLIGISIVFIGRHLYKRTRVVKISSYLKVI